MKIEKVITATNANKDYIEFVPLMCRAWKTLHNIVPVCGYVRCGVADIDSSNIEFIGKYCEVLSFERVLEIDYGIQSKITRLFLCSNLNSVNMVVDIDMIPLNRQILHSYAVADDINIVQWGYDHPAFDRHPDVGKWPMDKTAAHRNTFREIINPSNLSYTELLTSWVGGFPEDYRSNVANSFHNFSDESLLKCLYNRWKDKDARTTKIRRTDISGDFNNETVHGRVCRSFHDERIDTKSLSKYFEVHGPRPYSEHLYWYQPIEEFINNI